MGATIFPDDTMVFLPEAEWKFRGDSAVHIQLVPGQHCRPAKEVYDKIISSVSRSCISRDSCPPFVKNYEKWAGNFTQYEYINGVGLGCLLLQGGINHTLRRTPTPAGNTAAPFLHLAASRAIGKIMPVSATSQIAVNLPEQGTLIDSHFWLEESDTIMDTLCYPTESGRVVV